MSTAKLEDSVKMKDYIRNVRQTSDQLSELDVKLDKVAVVGFILNGLPDHYRYLVVNLESQVKTISYEDLSARLMDEEKRIVEKRKMESQGSVDLGLRNENQPVDSEMVAVHLAKPKGPICNRCKERGHIARYCPKKTGSTKCEWCGASNHEEEDCRVKEYQRKKSDPKAFTSDAYAGAYSAIFGG